MLIPCTQCQKNLKVSEASIGKKVRCPHCHGLARAPVPEAVKRSLFGPRIHGMAVYLKTFQHFS